MEYVKPILEVIYYEQEDIITMSGLNQFDNIGDDIDWENG